MEVVDKSKIEMKDDKWLMGTLFTDRKQDIEILINALSLVQVLSRGMHHLHSLIIIFMDIVLTVP
jgi:hypothetical protein